MSLCFTAVGFGALPADKRLAPAEGSVIDTGSPSRAVEALDWAQRLGYPAGRRVVILHADDGGMCPAANAAIMRYLQRGQMPSASIMVPCPAAGELMAWCREHPEMDVGIHATFTSEWKTHRWGPVTPRDAVPGLVDLTGCLWRGVRDVAEHASAAEVERELRQQVETALAAGFRPTHIDTHMGTLFARVDYFRVLVKVASEYDVAIPVPAITPERLKLYREKHGLLPKGIVPALEAAPFPKLTSISGVRHGPTYDAVRSGFMAQVRALPPGLHMLFCHPCDASDQLRRITGGWQQRVWEGRLFADEKVIAFFKKEQIELATWRDVMARYRRLRRRPHGQDGK